MPRRGLPDPVPGRAGDRADEQPGGAGAAAGGDRAEGVAVHEERGGDARLRGVDERPGDAVADPRGTRSAGRPRPAHPSGRPPARLSTPRPLINYAVREKSKNPARVRYSLPLEQATQADAGIGPVLVSAGAREADDLGGVLNRQAGE